MRTIEWAAGLFEGEGCITHNSNGLPRLIMSMTDEDVMESFRDIIGVGNVHLKKGKFKAHWKPAWEWTISKQTYVYRILEDMLPYFGHRRAYKAQNSLDAIDNYNYLKLINHGNLE